MTYVMGNRSPGNGPARKTPRRTDRVPGCQALVIAAARWVIWYQAAGVSAWAPTLPEVNWRQVAGGRPDHSGYGGAQPLLPPRARHLPMCHALGVTIADATVSGRPGRL
jgi:hypothetical protein